MNAHKKTRTSTGKSPHQPLKLARLPFRHVRFFNCNSYFNNLLVKCQFRIYPFNFFILFDYFWFRITYNLGNDYGHIAIGVADLKICIIPYQKKAMALWIYRII